MSSGGMIFDMGIDETKLRDLAKKHGIRPIVLYGSQAIGGATPESDFDVAVYLESAKVNKFYFDGYLDLLPELADALGAKGQKIDLVLLNSVNILLRYEITSKGQLLFGDLDQFAQYQAFAFRDYIDAKPLFDLEGELIHKRQTLIA